MGRKPIGVRALTGAERQRRWVEKQVAQAREGGACPSCARLQAELDSVKVELEALKARPAQAKPQPPHSVMTEQEQAGLRAEVKALRTELARLKAKPPHPAITEQDQATPAEDRALAAAEASFTDKQKLKLDDAIRIYRERLLKQYLLQLNEGIRQGVAEANQFCLEDNKRLRSENQRLDDLNRQRGVFTKAEFEQLLKTAYPDNVASVEVRNAAFILLEANKQRLLKPEAEEAAAIAKRKAERAKRR
jgi:hypothetical protein